ncbi:uncharacterized protein LOC127835646 [Dreissena polymorpha]|uniref:uncharacterized protein LOC127835646 n=1 Tax=Dreissena polymorpha TaxID=45954 RepID=UPI0022649E27|nr:uncharacterized protein LOC127835646 [Dreissena polymorpha]
MYAIIDDQSNRTLANSTFFDKLACQSEVVQYNLKSCGGARTSHGRVARDCVIESWDGAYKFDFPSVLECDEVPNVREEIPRPEVAKYHPHLRDIANLIHPIDHRAEIMLLIGRDLIDAHHVLEQRIGPVHTPYAQRLKLGYVVVGECCLGQIHKSTSVNVNKTFVANGRTTILTPCENRFDVKEQSICEICDDPIFVRTSADEKPAMSQNDKYFMKMMDEQFKKSHGGKWTAPLPFLPDRPRLPNKRDQALKRMKLIQKSMAHDEQRQNLFIDFMGKVLQNGHAERAPKLDPHQECWYLPIFGVSSAKNPNKIRCVFDSSARYNNISLNQVLNTGPDLTNMLLGILLRFRKERIAVTADIEQMFYNFCVSEEHRDYLRFLWFEDNDPQKPLVDYRMTVHVFGNSTSPAVATYGIRKIVENCEEDVKAFVNNDFYVESIIMMG